MRPGWDRPILPEIPGRCESIELWCTLVYLKISRLWLEIPGRDLFAKAGLADNADPIRLPETAGHALTPPILIRIEIHAGLGATNKARGPG
ncbi:hypothetical protein ACVW17_006263 [Bradyrhizobium sp. USDA 4473]